jgi:hypothetical protein
MPFLFRFEANWASAHLLPVLSVAGVQQLLSIASGPDQFQPAQFFFSAF